MRVFNAKHLFNWLLTLIGIGALLWVPAEIRSVRATRFYLDGIREVQARQYEKALPHFERAMSLVPTEPLFAFAEGYACSLSAGEASIAELTAPLKKQEADSKAAKCAVSSLRNAVELQPNDAMFHEDYGWALLSTGRPDLASAEFDRALALEPEDPLYLVGLGLERERHADTQNAYMLYGKAVAASPSLLDSAFFKELRARSPDGANSAIALGLQLSKEDSPISIAQRARILMEAQQLVQARTDLLKALAEVPNMPMAWLNLGRVADEIQEADQFSLYYERAYAIDPQSIPAMQRMAAFALSEGDIQSASNFNARVLLNPVWTEHAKRSYRLYGLQPVNPNDGLPRALMEYISPDRHVSETCREIYELLQQQGSEIDNMLAEKLRIAGNPCQ
jgi:Tfp pilus assembly protein PilF